MTVSNRGGGPASPLTMRLFELIDDGEWHAEDPIIREVGKLIPPGQAIRRCEVRRVGQRTKDNGERAPQVRKRELSEDRKIAVGRRTIFRDIMKGARKFIEVDVRDGERFIRMTGLPPRIQRDRARARAHFHFDSEQLVDEIAQGTDAPALLGELNAEQLMKVAIELARRERGRFLQQESVR